jgi:uncharacterized protein YjaG (DUF416 family)
LLFSLLFEFLTGVFATIGVCPRQATEIFAVIARSVANEAIQLARLTLDCFASLAMTLKGCALRRKERRAILASSHKKRGTKCHAY